MAFLQIFKGLFLKTSENYISLEKNIRSIINFVRTSLNVRMKLPKFWFLIFRKFHRKFWCHRQTYLFYEQIADTVGPIFPNDINIIYQSLLENNV